MTPPPSPRSEKQAAARGPETSLPFSACLRSPARASCWISPCWLQDCKKDEQERTRLGSGEPARSDHEETRDTKPGHPAHGREGTGDCTYVYIADTPAERFGITVHPRSAVCATTSTQQRVRPSPLGFPGSSVGFLQPAPSRRARGSCCRAERRHQQGKELHPLLNLGPFPAKLGLQRWGASPRSAVLPTSCT